MKQTFVPKNFRAKSRAIIIKANEIIEEYRAQGYSLTLRQLYYQFVARDLIPNTERSYKSLGSIINDARLAGYIDWIAIEDRTRNVSAAPHWDSPADVIQAARDSYLIDFWADQPRRVEVWIEKNALTGVIHNTCRELHVPYFACIGYVSQSEQWRAFQRSLNHPVTILHLGDHDPSGIDMTRDNDNRLNQVFGGDVDVIRIALNMDQIEQYNPPPNPAKVTDSRFEQYLQDYGPDSWELDALEPSVINDLIRTHVECLRDEAIYYDAVDRWETDCETLDEIIGKL